MQAASRAWRRPVLRAFVLALVATLAIWGRGLSSKVTFSPNSQSMTVRPGCRVGDARLTCLSPIEKLRSIDSGSPTWVSAATSYFLARAHERGEPRPEWNPYDGSGYPLALDGHSARFSPSEWFLSRVPGDEGQDIVIFLRFLSWTFALSWAFALFERSILLLTGMAFAATLAPYGASYLHIAFLDVDLLGPWFLLLLLMVANKLVPTRTALLAAGGLGLLAGTLAFPQAQVVMVMAMGVLALLTTPVLGARALLLFAALALGVLLVVPAWLPMLDNLDQFVSSRSVQCICSKGMGWSAFVDGFVRFPPKAIAPASVTLAGLVLLPWVPRRLWFLPLGVVLLGLWLIVGLPTQACVLPLVSGMRFARHLQPHVQMLFLLGTGLAITRLGNRFIRDRRPWLILVPTAAAAFWTLGTAPADRLGSAHWAFMLLATVLAFVAALSWRWTALQRFRRISLTLALMAFAFPPFVLGSNISRWLLLGQAATPQVPPLPAVLDPATPLGKVQQLSREQDRRHFSPTGWVFPNWSQALEILDLRSLNALYPVGIHQLNAGLFSGWERDPAHVLNPDRFTATAPLELYASMGFQRVMALHRVSLLTFSAGASRFPTSAGPYQRARCQLLGKDQEQGAESYLCPDVGGVGFFPEIVRAVGSRIEALSALNRTSPGDLARTALLGPELDPALGPAGPTVAKGRVVSMARSANHLLYWLDVEKPGTFVVADAYFRGWTAIVNGKPTAISRANVAFKAVQVPQGFVDLHFHFQLDGG